MSVEELVALALTFELTPGELLNRGAAYRVAADETTRVGAAFAYPDYPTAWPGEGDG